jgi:fatty-acyl-CoA synthase
MSSLGVLEWPLSPAIDVITSVVGDREAIVAPGVRRSYRDLAARSTGFGRFLTSREIGLRRERAELEPWVLGQSTVALLMSNCVEYVESMLGAYRARAVPVNVNHHYHPSEVADLLHRLRVEAVVYHRRLAPLLAKMPLEGLVLIEVDDGSDDLGLSDHVPFEDAVATRGGEVPEPSPDDVYLITTGGTTGPPKGVLWRQADAFVSTMSGPTDATAETLAESVTGPPAVWFAPSPLMHAAGQRTVFSCLLRGGTAILHDDRTPFDADAILDTAERERVNLMSIVGDAYASRLVESLRSRDRELSSLQILGTGGAAMGATMKAAVLELLPQVTIMDTLSSSETGAMAQAPARQGSASTAFGLNSSAAVLSDDRTRVLVPGDDEDGWIARRGRVPLGYLDDPDNTARTFPVIDGERYAIPGDRARLAADGTIQLLGRDSNVINSGGEKIFAEEVEDALRAHPDVVDAVVVGQPSERFGTEVVAIVQPRAGVELTVAELRAHTSSMIARFKAPRAVVFCDRVGRLASGKADYRWARDLVVASNPQRSTPGAIEPT